jgi:signal transduction histidine kinase
MTTAVAGLLAGLAILVGVVTEHLGRGWEQPAWIPILDLAVGWSMVVAGLVAAVARPRQVAGRRLVIAGFLWFAGTPEGGDTAPFAGLAFAFQGYYDLVLVLIALSFAARWPARRSERAYLVALAVVFVVNTVVRLAARSSELIGTDLLPIETGLPMVAWADLIRSAGVAFAAVLIARRWFTASGPARRYLGPVLLGGVATSAAAAYGMSYPLAMLGAVPPVPDDLNVVLAWTANVVRILVPIGMLVGILRSQRARSAVAGALTGIVAGPTVSTLGEALRQAVGDPSLRILGWDAEAGGYRDAAGGPAVPPAESETVAVTPVSSDGVPLAVLVHDPALDEDPALVASGVALATLVMHNELLGHQVDRQLAEVRASRARIVEAGDEERRRIERDLHDGVQQRLVALGLALRRAAARNSADHDAADALARGAEEALAVVEDVRELARGIHPAILSEAGLASGLRALADRSPVPVEVDARLDREPPPTTAATAYFVASEALANVAKHAAATTAWIRASDDDGVLRVAVEDDGRGGVDPAGSGLRGLQDRVSALGGTFTAAARPEGGTVVTASIPLA